jgi:hypothetical protein
LLRNGKTSVRGFEWETAAFAGGGKTARLVKLKKNQKHCHSEWSQGLLPCLNFVKRLERAQFSTAGAATARAVQTLAGELDKFFLFLCPSPCRRFFDI